MRYSASSTFCTVLLLSICSGCDVATSHHGPQPIHVAETEPMLSDSANLNGAESSVKSTNGLFTLVSNTTQTKNDPPPALAQPRSQAPNPQSPIQENLPPRSSQAGQATKNQTETDPALKQREKFHPPFAERTNVFTPPSSDQSVPINEGEESIAIAPVLDVSLKGFARVDDLRAILMIEDTIAPLGLGQEKQGIRIISIEPPKVTLERDEQRWTLTLSNQFTRSGNSRSRHSVRD